MKKGLVISALGLLFSFGAFAQEVSENAIGLRFETVTVLEPK